MKILSILALACSLSATAFAAQQQYPKVPGPIVVEPDQTDIYAIPLDEDADEQQQELYQLEHPKK